MAVTYKVLSNLTPELLSSDMPVISVLMPAFNVEKYISYAIESILNQSFTNFELIILDDGSVDGTVKMIDGYSDPRLKKIYLPTNKGLVYARNTLVSMAQGDYIAFLDADDFAEPNRLELQLDYLKTNQLDLCGADHFVLNQSSGEMKRSRQKHSDADIRALISVCSPLCNPSVMGCTEVFKGIKYLPGNDGAEDYVMWVNLALSGYKFGNVPKNLITYRVHVEQISQFQNARVNTIFNKHRERYIAGLEIDVNLIPRALSWSKRIKIAPKFLFSLNQKIPGISFGANYQIYARYQFRGSGIWTPLLRFERFLIALSASAFGYLSK